MRAAFLKGTSFSPRLSISRQEQENGTMYFKIMARGTLINNNIFVRVKEDKVFVLLLFFNLLLVGLSGFLATESQFRSTVHAASRHGIPSLTSFPKDGEVSCEVRPPRSPIRSLTPLDRA